ncbi:MAG: Asp-tRNA(Asn)/Glu-tRNA(Gln) amidotransferase subunit GatC [Elusimicrobiales bacterium]
MAVTENDAKHIAKLARLELTEQEIKLYGGQLDAILQYAGQLDEPDTAPVPPTAHALGIENVMREDLPRQSPARGAILANFPHREFDLLKVRKVIE